MANPTLVTDENPSKSTKRRPKIMNMRKRTRVLTLVASMALLGGTAWAAAGSTGAYFSDTVNGGVTGTVGDILITSVPATPDISFSNDLLPGVPESVTVSYSNTGTSPEDVYLTFPNLTALSALNNLGRYGSVTISTAAYGTRFQSYNLNDNSTTCGPFSNAIPTGPTSGCWPLTSQVLLTSNLPAGQGDSFTFTFEYASALIGSPLTTSPWNSYPTAGSVACTPSPSAYSGTCTNGQFVVNGSDGSGAGLPFNLVATQVGILPGATGSKF
jgi:hypothetical protein